MYDAHHYWPYDDEPRSPELDRLTHLVLVDGRLVDTWSEPVTGTRWQHHADRFDRLDLPVPPPEPRLPPYDAVLGWLGSVCGGGVAVAALTTEPLTDDGLDLPETTTLATRHRLERSAELLDGAAALCFDVETGHALRRALLLVWELEHESAMHMRTPAHLAGGICWVVGKANNLFGTHGMCTQKAVQDAIGLTTTISACGPTVQRALRGFADHPPRRPCDVPDLAALGHPDLLTSATRRMLVRLRDRAQEAKTAAETAVLP